MDRHGGGGLAPARMISGRASGAEPGESPGEEGGCPYHEQPGAELVGR
jgi:hypothetical protein